MALRSFNIAQQKALVLAICEDVPPLMIVAGPNGVGKSSLLYALKRRDGAVYEPETQVLYQPPHRAIRRHQVRRRWLQASNRGYGELLAGDDVGGYEGINFQNPQRLPDNIDESGSTLKYTLGRTENKRESALAALVDAAQATGEPLTTASLPDVFSPLKRLVSTLLPHLEFRGISFRDEDDIGVTFRLPAAQPPKEVDLNDLSSGEKAVLLLFMPLIETEIDRLLARLIEPGSSDSKSAVDRLLLIDEPEEHLHPELQGRVLTYLREEATRGGLQAVLATHSPAILDLATDSELFVLNRPLADGRNQLARVATSMDRLDALKELVGNPYVLTTGRTVILVEGPPGDSRATDVRLLDRLHPAATRFTFVPMGGRGTVLSAVRGLRDQISEARFGITVLGLVDRDRDGPEQDSVVAWAFATIENILVMDSAAITTAIAVTAYTNVDEGRVDSILERVAHGLRDDEVRMRVSEAMRTRTIRIGGATVDQVTDALRWEAARLEAESQDETHIADIVAHAREVVDTALSDGSFRRKFRGRELIRGLLGELKLHNVSYNDFLYALADAGRDSATVAAEVETVFGLLEDARKGRLEAVAREETASSVAATEANATARSVIEEYGT